MPVSAHPWPARPTAREGGLAGVQLLGAGHFTMSQTRAGGAMAHRAWVLELVVAGRLEVNVEASGWHTCAAGQALLYRPYTRYRERVPAGGVPVCKSVCLFFELPRAPLFEAWRRPEPSFRSIDDPERVLRRLVDTVLAHLGRSEADDLLALGCFHQVLGTLLKADRGGAALTLSAQRPAEDDVVSRAHDYMRANLSQPLTLPRIAQAVGLSESGFAHAYRRLTGRSPMSDLRRMRIDAVKVHLLSNRLSLAGIAAQTGFADPFHLSRTFKRIVGIPPSDFRRGHTREAKEVRD